MVYPTIARIGLVGWLACASAGLAQTKAVGSASAEQDRKRTADRLLESGRYREIKPGADHHGRAEWCFAQFYLAPSAEMLSAARVAHNAGEPLGSFVLMMCHREGVAVRRDEKTMFRLSFQIHRKLSARSDLTPMDMFLLSQTFIADANGYANPREIDLSAERQKRQNWLTKSAERGVAQACNQLGRENQDKQNYIDALKWYKRAANIGLAAGIKNVGALLMDGRGAERDPSAAAKATRRAAKGGDVFAMINLAVWYDRGWGVELNRKAAREWIVKASQSGHWAGPMEYGLALLKGHYGFDVDRPKGVRQLQRAIATGCERPLTTLATWYAGGCGVQPDGRKAVELAEAAFTQGSTDAAKCLAKIFHDGTAGISPNERLSRYWSIQSNPSMAFAYHVDVNYPDMTRRIAKIDPFSIRLVPEKPDSSHPNNGP